MAKAMEKAMEKAKLEKAKIEKEENYAITSQRRKKDASMDNNAGSNTDC